MNDKGISDKMRTVLIDYKHDRIGLGDAMRRLKTILYTTNDNWWTKGNISGRWFSDKQKNGPRSESSEK